MKPIHNDAIQAFISLIRQGIECWIKAGEIAAAEIAKNQSFIDDVCKACPGITPEAIRRFELIGLKRLHPELCLSEAPGVRRLRRLSYPTQERYVSAPVEVLIKTSNGHETLLIDIRNLTYEQAAQVFKADGIRSVAEQRAWMEDRLTRTIPPTKSNLPYRVVKNEIVVMQPCRITKKEALQALAEMI